jgi:hypothetical protein
MVTACFLPSLYLILMQIYTENWVNSPGQMEDNSWQAFVFVPKDNWYIARVGPSFSCLFAKA